MLFCFLVYDCNSSALKNLRFPTVDIVMKQSKLFLPCLVRVKRGIHYSLPNSRLTTLQFSFKSSNFIRAIFAHKLSCFIFAKEKEDYDAGD
jgi:hypothetical protein